MAPTREPAAVEYSDRPPVLIFADSAAARGAAEKAVDAAGGRVSAVLPVAAALERLQSQAAIGAAVVEIEEDGGDALDALLDRLEQGARSGRHASIVIVPPALIDVAAARVGDGEVTLLAAPDQLERAAAIGAALARRPHRLGDVGTDGQHARLKELAEEVARIARTLATLAAEDGTRPAGASAAAGVGGEAGAAAPIDAGLIRAMIRARRLREQYFPAGLFADPAWDMLLDLAAARIERRAVAVSSLCIAAAVPPTTALRWIKTLTEGKLFARVADASDGRRVFIELTEQAAAGMAYLAGFQRIMTPRA